MASIEILKDIRDLERVLHQRLLLTRLGFKEIRANRDYSDRYIQGKIKSTGNFTKHLRFPMQYRKLCIEESETCECFNVVVKVSRVDENLANQISFLKEDNLRTNDVLVITNFEITDNPLYPEHDMSNKLQAVVDLSLVDSKIIVVKSNIGSNERKGQHRNASSVSMLPTPSLSKSKSQQKKPYVYVKLRDLTPGTCVNILGYVKFVREPSKSRGSDVSMAVTIVDETKNDTISKLKCVLFDRAVTLPHVTCGQIIRFHRLKISTHNGELQGGNGPGFSWVVFDGSVDAPLAPISTSSVNNTLTDDVEEMVKQLRLWADSTDLSLSQDLSTHYKPLHCSLCDIKLYQYFDLNCQVVGKCIIVDGESMLFKVWDGTRVKIKLYKQDLSDDVTSRFEFLQPLAKSALDYIVDVFVYDDHFNKATQVKPGDFIKLRNLHAARHKPRPGEEANRESPSAELCLHRGTDHNRCLTVLEPTSAEYAKLKQNLDRALAENDYMDDSTEELWTETPAASSSGQAAVTSTAQVLSVPERESNLDSIREEEESEEFFTPGLPSGVSRLLLSKSPVVGANSLEESIRVEEAGLAENEENLPISRNSTSKNVSKCAGDVPPKKRKFCYSKSLSEGKENAKVDENEAVDYRNSENVNAKGSQCSIEPSPDFATDRCMLTTATVLIGHSHIAITRVDKIKKQAHPNKFRFQGYAINYKPNSETVDGFLRLYCERCRFSSPLPSSDECPSLNLSLLSVSIREPELKCTNNGISTYSCPSCKADLEYIFMVEFILNDGTGQLYAGLWRQDADHFFGCTPLDLLRNPGAYKEIKEKLNVMCFGLKTSKNVDRRSDMDRSDASLMECCLKSYTVPCGVAYQIFDTTFAVTT